MAGESVAFPRLAGAQEHLEISHIGKDNIDERQPIQRNVPLATEVPVIDLRRLLAASNAADLEELRSALASWGCFQVINHGVESSLQDEVRRICKEFFQLPLSEKEKYVTQGGDDEGREFLRLLLSEKDNCAMQGLRNPWPQNPHSFKEVMVEYSDKLIEVKAEILKLVAKSLNLSDEEIFIKKTEIMYGQYNYYPPCPKPDQVLAGLRQHSDATVITILLQDDKVGGLQLLKDDTWLSVPVIPNAFLIIVGDQLEIMSNGIYKSIVHRAVRVSSEIGRFSLALFCAPNSADEIGPLDELVDGERPRLFKNVVNYVKFFYPYFHQAKRAIDELRI